MALTDDHVPAAPAISNVIDIRQDVALTPLVDQIRCGLQKKQGQEKSLPTLLLYNEQGLKLFERITYLDEYYLTNAEIDILEKYADRIADRIAQDPESVVVELGSGNLRKVKILLDALDRKGKNVSYYALDLNPVELDRTLAEVPHDTFKNVKCFGLLGTYDEGLAWLKRPENIKKPKTIVFLGSSIGNFQRDEAAQFLHQFSEVLGPNDKMLVGVDGCIDGDKVFHAYNDREGLTHEFILNGLRHANELLGHEAFRIEDWKVIGEYDQEAGRHHAFVVPTKGVEVEGVRISAGERVRIEESYKYGTAQTQALWSASGLTEGAKWTDSIGDYALHLLNTPKVSHSMDPQIYASQPVPDVANWEALWSAWDTVTLDMIPKEELLAKPIKLRNACIFYLGHIPTFVDIHLTRATRGKPTDPSYYPQIFERGIDPDVDDPEQCHSHSEIPDSWPPASEILDFQSRVRMRIKKLYQSGEAFSDRAIARALWLCYEHEIMHMETLLYMLVQSEKTLPPSGTIRPDFEVLAKQAKERAVASEWFTIPEQDVVLGLEDPDDDSGPSHFYGWDNEKPQRKVHVGAFKAKGRAITNGEYAHYLQSTDNTKLPASWMSLHGSDGINGHSNGDSHSNGHQNGSDGPSAGFLHGKAVRTVYGAVPLEFALEWPVPASYDELLGCAQWMGGRIPTMGEARSLYQYAEQKKKEAADKALGKTIPAVNGHLVNDGVEETPPFHSSLSSSGSSKTVASGASSSINPQELFIDLSSGQNVGFKHWHPMPVTQNGGKLSGQSDMGGVWEWTSTVLESHEGFAPMQLYPGYTADFFDGKHNIVLGGSWATHPRIAGRKSL